MCLIFLSLQQHPDYKLIVAANRDEFYKRKTAPAHPWEDYPHIIGGRDLEACGTWMGMTKQGKISMVTNYRDPFNIDPTAPSRGQLVSDYLANGDAPKEYMEKVLPNSKQYNGFNLVVGTVNELYYHSNYKGSIEQLSPGLYGLSNHLLNTPWPKVKRGIDKMQTVLKTAVDAEVLFNVLLDDTIAHDAELPDTGIGLERERALSSMFIKTNGYGTRCSTVILVDKNDRVEFKERVYNTETFDYTTQAFTFVLES